MGSCILEAVDLQQTLNNKIIAFSAKWFIASILEYGLYFLFRFLGSFLLLNFFLLETYLKIKYTIFVVVYYSTCLPS
jgi:hypothetical protein